MADKRFQWKTNKSDLKTGYNAESIKASLPFGYTACVKRREGTGHYIWNVLSRNAIPVYEGLEQTIESAKGICESMAVLVIDRLFQDMFNKMQEWNSKAE